MTEFTDKFLYRITGKQSIERLDPLIAGVVTNCCAWDKETQPHRQLDFVWETTCEKDLREHHNGAKVINKLHNSQIIESKSSLAYLQLLVDYPMLDTKIAYSSAEVEAWAKRRWHNASTTAVEDRDWWVVKASKGNGGRDVWVFNQSNHEKVISELPANEEYVIQRYVNNPLLFRGKKFHFRCYSVMTAGGAALVYRNAFILSAGLDFDYKDDDMRKHVTNLSVNKRFAGHPGQVPCNLQSEYPEIYVEIKRMWSAIVKAALPYMQEQSSARHFEFFGIDIIADSSNHCWLVEANRLPGLESSSNNQEQEDAMYDEMMTSLLRVVLLPAQQGDDSARMGLWEYTTPVNSSEQGIVSSEPVEKAPSNGGWKNLLKWRAFTRKNRERVLAEYA